MTSRERLLTVLRRGRPDRVPVSLYEFAPYNIEEWFNTEPSYAPLIELERRYGDSFVRAPLDDCPVLLGDPNNVHGTQARHEDGTLVQTTEIDTPKGRLRSVTRRDPGLMTNWQIEPLIKSDEDIERVLSMPDPPCRVNEPRLRELESRMGDHGILIFSVGDALGHVVGLFDFEDFVLRCASDDGPILALLEKVQTQVLRAIREYGTVVKNAAIRLWGPEYAGAPLMNPRVYFRRYVVEQDKAAAQAIHDSGNLCVIHCHGRLRDLLDMILETGADALEPIETLPMSTADVTLAEVKAKLGGRMCVMGAVQSLILETATPQQMREHIRQAIEVGAPDGGFVLLPTAAPFMVPLDPRCLENARIMYEVAHEFGAYGS
jgi:CBS domain-containing protein